MQGPERLGGECYVGMYQGLQDQNPHDQDERRQGIIPRSVGLIF